MNSKAFFIPHIQTPKAIIVVHSGKRTIFSQGLTGIAVSETHIQKRLDLLDDLVQDADPLSYADVPAGPAGAAHARA